MRGHCSRSAAVSKIRSRGAWIRIELLVCIYCVKESDRISRGSRLAIRENKMALELRNKCERCERPSAPADEAYICTYECTFCPACASALEKVCPNCGGELVRRPRPRPA